jgi:CheY-like chemotaxis protein
MDKAFDPYFTTKKVGEGTGMGLAVVHGIIKNHGGEIKVSSIVGEGTQFDMYFPSIDEASAKDQKPQKVDIPMGKGHILVVDDEEAIGQMTKEILERFGYHVTLKMDGMEAFEVFCKDPDRFDLILTDQTMPQMTGVKLARKVKDIRPNIPIILSTGHNELVNEMVHKNAGIDHCIRKPFIIRELTQQIRSVLDDVSGANQK